VLQMICFSYLIVGDWCRVYNQKEEGADADFDAQLASKGLCNSFKIWIGKDYVNFIFKDFCDLDHPFTGMCYNSQFLFMTMLSLFVFKVYFLVLFFSVRFCSVRV